MQKRVGMIRFELILSRPKRLVLPGYTTSRERRLFFEEDFFEDEVPAKNLQRLVAFSCNIYQLRW